MGTPARVTFGKKTSARPGDNAEIVIFLDGRRAGYIEIAYDDANAGTSIYASRYVVGDYTVSIFVGNAEDVVFSVSKYASTQAALGAAKDYARRILEPHG